MDDGSTHSVEKMVSAVSLVRVVAWSDLAHDLRQWPGLDLTDVWAGAEIRHGQK